MVADAGAGVDVEEYCATGGDEPSEVEAVVDSDVELESDVYCSEYVVVGSDDASSESEWWDVEG